MIQNDFNPIGDLKKVIILQKLSQLNNSKIFMENVRNMSEKRKSHWLSVAFVGVAGFEPTTSTSQMWRDTGLRYTPKRYHLCFVWHKYTGKINYVKDFLIKFPNPLILWGLFFVTNIIFNYLDFIDSILWKSKRIWLLLQAF